jgi:GntR family transcriptional regulator / MocR family aminotransferase
MTTFRLPSRCTDSEAMLSIALNRRAREPLSRQLYLLLSDHIRSGRLAAGARLTSTRRFALDLGVSRTVTLSAYGQLASEGYIEPRRGSGQFVRALGRPSDRTRRQVSWRKEDADSATNVLNGKPFDPTSQIEGLFPRDSWIRSLGRSWRKQGKDAEMQGNWAGLPSLREATARYVYSLRGIACTADQVLITSGNTDALQLITDALAPTTRDRKAGVWVEDPGHVNARRVFMQNGLRLIPVPVDDWGINVATGRRIADKARFALVTPSRQFPLGMPLTLERRLALIGWARESGGILIEDDYDTEVRFSGRPIPSLLNLDPRMRALSLGSLSKVTFPGLRLGYIVGERRLIKRLAEGRERTGTPVATTAQPALASFLAGGGFAKHLRVLRREVSARRQALITALATRLPEELTILPQEVGMHLTVTLKQGMPHDSVVAATAAQAGLNLHPLSTHFHCAAAERCGFLLGYAGWNEGQLAAAVNDFAKLLL